MNVALSAVGGILLGFGLGLLLASFLYLIAQPTRAAAGHFDWKIGQAQNKQTKGITMIELKLTNEQKIKVTLTPMTSTGKPAAIDGKPSWSVSSGDATVEVSDDGLSAYLISSDVPGESLIVVEADADLGEGVETISDAVKLTVEGAKAVSLGLVAGTPEPK